MELQVRGAQVEQVRIREAGMYKHHSALLVAYNCQGLEKKIPDTPKGETPVHLRTRNIFATH